MQRHAVWQWVGADDGAPWWSGGRKMGGKLCKGNANGRRPTIGGRALSHTSNTFITSARVTDGKCAYGLVCPPLLERNPWSLVQFGHDNGRLRGSCTRAKKDKWKFFQLLPQATAASASTEHTHTNKNKKGTFNALKCGNAHISFMVPFRHRDSPNHQ